MSQKWMWKNVPVPMHCFDAVDSWLGRRLPDEVRLFLAANNGASPKNRLFCATHGRVFVFELVVDIVKREGDGAFFAAAECAEGRLLPGHLPIGVDPFGNLFCIDVRSKECPVFFLRHDEDVGCECISPSFSEFISSLRSGV